MQLLLVEPLFDFYMATHMLQQSTATPLLLFHVRQRCGVALTSRGHREMDALISQYMHSAKSLAQLSMFGGSDAAVSAAAQSKAAAVLKMRELLSCPQFQNTDLQRLLSLNAAFFMEYASMVTAMSALLVEQLQQCLQVPQLLDMWPQLVQQCSPQFLDFLRDPGCDVSDEELVQPPAAVEHKQQLASSGPALNDSDRSNCSSDISKDFQLEDILEESTERQQRYQHLQQQHEQHQYQCKLTDQHFVRSMSVLSKEQRKVLLAARSLMTRAGVAWEMQQRVVHCTIEHMGAHIDVHTEHIQLSNGRRSETHFIDCAATSCAQS
jgi:hypothetical protein